MAIQKEGMSHLPGAFRVGDRVRFHFGNRMVEGRIIEDRGPIGVGGRRLYGIEFDVDRDYRAVLELPREEIQPVAS